MNDNYERAFYNRKTGGGSNYNYELSPLIENFTFYDFVTTAEKSKENLGDYGGFLVITNNQYIIGYNAGFGKGTHISAFARTMIDINTPSKRNITSDQDAIKLSRKCKQNYIIARIVYESHKDNETGKIECSGSITFNLCPLDGKITPSQFETFKQFYNDYNEDIKYITKKYSFYVTVDYKDEYGKKQYKILKDLDWLYNYLEQNIDCNKVIEEEQIIIGKERKNRKK